MDRSKKKQLSVSYLDLRNGTKLDALLAMGKPIAVTKRGKHIATLTPEEKKRISKKTRKQEVEDAIEGLKHNAKYMPKIPDDIKIDRAFIYEH